MSGGPYMVNFGSRLGQVQNPMAGAAAPNLATYNPVEGAIWSKWKPVGESLQEGLQEGLKTGENIAEFPEQKKAMELANQTAAMDNAAKLAQIEQTEAQTYGVMQQYQGGYARGTKGPLPFTPTAGANAAAIMGNVNKIMGVNQEAQAGEGNTIPGQNPASSGGTAGGGNAPQQNQPQQPTNQPTQPGGNGPSPIAAGSGVTEVPGAGVTPGSGSYGDVGMNNPTNQNAIEAARMGWIQKNQPQGGEQPNLASSGLGTPGAKDLGVNSNLLEQGQDGTYTVKNPQQNLTMSPDGRYFLGMAKTGAPVYYDPLKNDSYIYTPEADGKERRFYSRTANADEWQHGVESTNPQEEQRQNWVNYLNQQNADPRAFYGNNADPTWKNHSSVDLLNATEILHNQAAKTPVDSGEADEMNKRMAELDQGNKVLQALGQLKPEEYNALNTAIKSYGDKFATAPVIGDIIKGLGANPNPNLTNLLQSYGAYLDAARGTTTGTMRALPEEFKALQSSIGSPTENNWSFAQRFGNTLNQQRLNFVDRVNTMLAQGKRMSWMEQTPNGMDVKVTPWMDRADQLKPLIAGYANNVRRDVAVPGTNSTQQPTAQASPTVKPGANAPLQTITKREDLTNIPAGQGAMFNGKALTPAQVQAAKNRYMQAQGQ